MVLSGLENMDVEEIEDKAKSLLELCKNAKSAWNNGCDEERLALVKRLCSNLRLDGVSLCYDLKLLFKKLLELKRNTEKTRWCARGDLNPYIFRLRLLRPACLPIPPPALNFHESVMKLRKTKGTPFLFTDLFLSVIHSTKLSGLCL